MSKGGAGKVYFVLYLAVILELLIIFIERDEAEENLRRQQQQAIQIVLTILSQLQTGAGYTGITASPKDNIVLDPKDSKNDVRNYTVFVAVGDPKASTGQPGKQVHGDDIPKLEYIVSQLKDPAKPENELGSDTADIDGSSTIFHAALGTDYDGMYNPRALIGSPPAEDQSKYFTLLDDQTNEQTARGRRVKVFGVNFKPTATGPGWYRLRFTSETNKILGVSGAPKDEDTVRIGNIRLTVKQLRQVQKVLVKRRAADPSVSRVENYITQLLTPDAYKTLAENKGSTSFNVRVVKPTILISEPFAQIASTRDTIFWLNVAPFRVNVTLGPKDAQRKDVSGAKLTQLSSAEKDKNIYLATIDNPTPGTNKLTAIAVNGGKTATDEKYLVVEEPLLRAAKPPRTNGIDAWRALTATYGRPYDPSSDWANVAIPADHYQTVVTIKGKEVLNRPGVNFKNLPDDLKNAMTIPDGTKAEEILTKVFWKPGGTADQTQWKLLLCNQPNQGQIIPLEKKSMKCVYPRPVLDAEVSDFSVQFNPRVKTWTSPIMHATQQIGKTLRAADVTISCPDCDKYGLVTTVNQQDQDFTVTFAGPTDFSKLLKQAKEVNGKRFELSLNLRGLGDPSEESMSITLQVVAR